MKLNIAFATTVAAASLATSALAVDSTQFAIDHFNQSADTSEERISVGPNGPVLGTTVSSIGSNGIGAAISHFNASIDSAGERLNSDTVTVFSGGPAYAADIFEQLRLADDDDGAKHILPVMAQRPRPTGGADCICPPWYARA